MRDNFFYLVLVEFFLLVQCLEDCWKNIANNLPSTEQAKKKNNKKKKVPNNLPISEQATKTQNKINFFSFIFHRF